MSIKHKSETPHVDAGPAAGKDSEPLKNQVLSTGEGHEYTGDVTPGTDNIVYPGHQEGGPGHKDCDHD